MLKNDVVKGFRWDLTTKVVVAGLQIVLLAILGRILEPETFGRMGILILFISFSKMLSEFGLGAALVYKSEVGKNDKETVMFFSILISSILTIILLLLSERIARFFSDIELYLPLQVISVVFVIDSICVVQLAVARKIMDFKFINIVRAVSFIFGNFICAIFFSYLGFNLWALIISYIFSSLLTLVFFIYKYGLILPKLRIQKAKELLSYGTFFTMGRIVNYFANHGDNFIVAKLLGNQALGFYSRSYQLMIAPANLLGDTLQAILFPAFSKIKNDKFKLSKYFLAVNRIVAYPTLLVSVIIYFLGHEIVYLILGQSWEASVTPFIILSGGLFFKMGYKITTPIMNSLGMVKVRLAVELIYFFFIILFSYLGSKYGINGVAVGVTFSLLCCYLISTIIVIKYLNISLKEMLLSMLNPCMVAGFLCFLIYVFTYDVYYGLVLIVLFFLSARSLYKENFFYHEILILKGVFK